MLSNHDVIVLRDVQTQYYLDAGQSDAVAFAKLSPANVATLQPSLYFQVVETPVSGFWMIRCVASGQYWKVEGADTGNRNKLSWTDVAPTSDTVLDKTPYYFSFVQVPNASTLVLGTYYNGGLSLQTSQGTGSDLIFGVPNSVPGTTPEVVFELSVQSGETLAGLLLPSQAVSGQATSTTTVDGWAVAFIVLIAALALVALAYGLWLVYKARKSSGEKSEEQKVGGRGGLGRGVQPRDVEFHE